MKHTDNEDKTFSEFFETARNLTVEPPAFIRAKVLMSLTNKNVSFWDYMVIRRLSYALFAMILLSFSAKLILTSQSSDPLITYKVGHNYLMKVSIQELNFNNISYVEIIPSENISFVSNQYPNISKQTSLKLLGQTLKSMQHIPIAFKGNSIGSEYVQLRFFDKNLEIVYEKSIELEVISG